MLGKLIKYDLLADYKKYAAVYISMLSASVLLLFFDKMTSWINNNDFLNFMTAVFAVLFLLFSAASGIMLLVFSTIRFYKNIVRDEGYLMHTLPVPTWQLIASKFISVYIWFFATLIVSVVCSGIASGDLLWFVHGVSAEFKEGFQIGYNAVNGPAADMITEEEGQFLSLMFKYYFVIILLSPFLAMASIYFSFALGNLFNKSKLAMSVVMYFLLQVAATVIETFCIGFAGADFTAEVVKFYEKQEELPMSVIMDFFGQVMTVTIIVSVILSVGFTIAAERIFAKKLNLE